ncbi:aquaporin-11 [Anthonomus grandis grandis]|uniref:aquaporin-11 n=1 Tax=Anthonomus grandis grandis TaxID=2921223 RepID=UPI002166B241|nr:aquaporin-11 [Anthonomus grandis grandis]
MKTAPNAGFPKLVVRTLKDIGVLGFNKRRNIFGMNPLLISVGLILFTLYLASKLRKVVWSYIEDSLAKQLLLEFIATLELCAACYELIIVADNWGVGAYALFLLLLTIWWSNIWGDASACPYSPMEEAFLGLRTWKSTLNVIGVQLLAAILTFRYVQLLWAVELAETHQDKAYEDCSADLQIDMVLGAIVECALTCMCRVVSKILAEKSFRFSWFVDAFFSTAMVVLAFNLTGGYFNPALATSLKFGCAGNTVLEHIVVYWVGACTGALLSCIIFESNAVQNFIKREVKEE